MIRTDNLIKEAKEVLQWDILKFWSVMQDPQGGFFGDLGSDGEPDREAPRSLQLNARILWAYSTAYRLFKQKEYLMPAINANDYFLKNFIDHKFGGVYSTVDKNGERVDTDCTLANQALSIYALSEFYAATKDDEALKSAVNLYKIVRKEFRDEEKGGYYFKLSREFEKKDATKDAVAHVYLAEGLSTLYRVWKDEALRYDLTALLTVITDKFYDVRTGHMVPKMDKDWNNLNMGIQYGLDLEASWALLDAAYATEDMDVVNMVKDPTTRLLMYGMEGQQVDGHVAFGIDADGKLYTTMVPYVQAEAVIANLCGWKYQCFAEGADNAFSLWAYIKAHLSDSANANAFRKYPMHAARACVYIMSLFR